MSCAEQIIGKCHAPGMFTRLLSGISARLNESRGTVGRKAPAGAPSAAEQHAGAIDTATAVDIGLGRRFSGYRSHATVERGSGARLHRIAGSISSTLPR